MKGSGRGLIWNTSPVFTLKDWGKSRKTLGQPAENWTQEPPPVIVEMLRLLAM